MLYRIENETKKEQLFWEQEQFTTSSRILASTLKCTANLLSVEISIMSLAYCDVLCISPNMP